VSVAARAACQAAGLDLAGASVAIEGFGKVGGGVARYITEMGAQVAAISTVNGAAYNPDGLDVERLLQTRKERGDGAVDEYPDAEHLPREALFTLPVDVLVPGARPYVIDKDLAGRVRARVISSIANIPITAEGEEVLFERGVLSVPDFISNAGGVMIAVIDFLGGTAESVFRILDDLVGRLTTEALTDARRAGVNPRALAVRRTEEKILKARRQQTAPSLEETVDVLRNRFRL
ncbi:MAG: hypothetical protein KKB20_06005, partial [Proteobacteria bacterium]|nr:hypothetical protein [Pseudomonadota bacterium]